MRYKKILGAVLSVAMLFNTSAVSLAAEEAVVEETTPFVTEIPGTETYKENYNRQFDYVTGYASVSSDTADTAVKDRMEYLGTEYHRKVSTAGEFAAAVKEAREGKVKIIELIDDINLGYNSFTAEEKTAYKGFLSEYKKPSPNASISTMTELGGFTNPEAQKNGVTSFKISETNGLTIFSTKGNSISYAELNINRNAKDIVIRNIHFKNMWQWDDDGKQKAVGWSNLKLNEGHNIWIDHCSFDAAFDGNIDIENGASGISITWCKLGQTPEEAVQPGNAIYDSITLMEKLYTDGKLTQGLYKKMRDAGATAEQIMQYSAYHDKCHLCGSGDKDCVDYSDTIRDSNGNIRVTLAYNHYISIGQRLPMIRQGVGHMFNCYIDDTRRQEILNVPAIKNNATSNYKMSRCINARNGASIAADTCVFNGVEQPVIGAETQGQDLSNMDARFQTFFKNAVNRSLVVNSKVVNSKGTYIGSSWDNEGVNAFTSNFKWNDKSTIGNWAWSSTITNIGENKKEDIEKKAEAYEFEFAYNTDEQLPYVYRVMPLEQVEEIVTAKAGCDTASIKTETEWCRAYAPNAQFYNIFIEADDLDREDLGETFAGVCNIVSDAVENEEVIFEVVPDAGYELDSVAVKALNDNIESDLNFKFDMTTGKGSFVMPAAAVEVKMYYHKLYSGEEKPEEKPEETPGKDISESDVVTPVQGDETPGKVTPTQGEETPEGDNPVVDVPEVVTPVQGEEKPGEENPVVPNAVTAQNVIDTNNKRDQVGASGDRVEVKQADGDTLSVIQNITGKGKTKSIEIIALGEAGNPSKQRTDFTVTLNAGTKYSVKGDYKVISANNGTEINDVKALKKLAVCSKPKNGMTVLNLKAIKAKGAYKVTIADESENVYLHINVENIGLQKKYEVTPLSATEIGFYQVGSDNKAVKINTPSTIKSAEWYFGKIKITTKQDGKEDTVLKKGSKVLGTAYVSPESGNVFVKLADGVNKGSIKLKAVINKKSYATTLKIIK